MHTQAGKIPGSCLVASLLLAGSVYSAKAQNVKRPPLRVPEIADSALQLVPQGWRLEIGTLIEVDLNDDRTPDTAMVISHGGFEANTVGEPAILKHVLVLALRGVDGKLHRSVVNDAVVLDGDEGGAFGDPFESLMVVHGTLVLMHYGGSRQRWGYTHQYRYQNGDWKLIDLSYGTTDSLDLEHYDNHDINLTTGLVQASEKGNYEGLPAKAEVSGSYYELEVLRGSEVPNVDGRIGAGEWPPYEVFLNEKAHVYRNEQLWRGPGDLSAKLRSARIGADVFVSAEVTDNNVTVGDKVRLVTRKGVTIRPRQSKTSRGNTGYVFEARYSLKELARAASGIEQYMIDDLERDSPTASGPLEGLELPVSVEVIDVDRPNVRKVRGVLSTRLTGSPYSGALRIYRKGALVLKDDTDQ
jgi:hypothetical protein